MKKIILLVALVLPAAANLLAGEGEYVYKELHRTKGSATVHLRQWLPKKTMDGSEMIPDIVHDVTINGSAEYLFSILPSSESSTCWESRLV